MRMLILFHLMIGQWGAVAATNATVFSTSGRLFAERRQYSIGRVVNDTTSHQLAEPTRGMVPVAPFIAGGFFSGAVEHAKLGDHGTRSAAMARNPSR